MRYFPHCRRRIIQFLLPLILIMPEVCYSQDWIWQNPSPQGNTLYSASALSANSVVMTGGVGTIVRTTNNGTTWNTGYSSASFSGTLRGSFFLDANDGWVVGDSGIILSTANGG